MHSDPGDKNVTIGDAMLSCSKEGGRLLPISNCDQVVNVSTAIYHQLEKTGQKYIIGAFSHTNGEGTAYRNWPKGNVIDS